MNYIHGCLSKQVPPKINSQPISTKNSKERSGNKAENNYYMVNINGDKYVTELLMLSYSLLSTYFEVGSLNHWNFQYMTLLSKTSLHPQLLAPWFWGHFRNNWGLSMVVHTYTREAEAGG
jgi:hypothetical protein